MAIRWDPPDIDEIVNNLEDNSSLTICGLNFVNSNNTLFMNFSKTFPDLSVIKRNQEVYFAELNGKIILSFKPLTSAVMFTRHLQTYGPKTGTPYFRTPIPIQLRKRYHLDNCKKAHLIQLKDYYECIFI